MSSYYHRELEKAKRFDAALKRARHQAKADWEGPRRERRPNQKARAFWDWFLHGSPIKARPKRPRSASTEDDGKGNVGCAAFVMIVIGLILLPIPILHFVGIPLIFMGALGWLFSIFGTPVMFMTNDEARQILREELERHRRNQ